jgi:cation diffusion facilitator CzcD-associated flavoprotein CzcO
MANGRTEEVDVVIVGAGISGIAMARQVSSDHPGMSYLILEGRSRVGGTWDLFRYPGIRSDSGMGTFAYSFRPWPGTKHFGTGEQIRDYLEETAAEYGIDQHIRFNHKVRAADWDSATARWTVTVDEGSDQKRIRARFLIGCTGYYRYDQGFSPAFEGEENFEGELFHAQHWPEDLELKDRRFVVIGSGATAITVVPALAEAGADVTMLQRSPSYVVSIPSEGGIGDWIRERFSPRRAAFLLRWLGILMELAQFNLARRFPNLFRRLFISGARKQLPAGYERRHLNPAYDPWVQRVCFAPDGDYYAALSGERARIETGNIERIGPDRIHLREGTEIEADVIVKATGLDLLIFGDIEMSVDGEPVDPADHLVYKGAMLSGVPNFIFVVGYTNASWTLKSELISRFASRFITTVERRSGGSETGAGVPIAPDGPMETVPLLNLQSGYIRRAESRLPKAGDVSPWVLHMNYFSDRRELLRGDLEDGTIRFS